MQKIWQINKKPPKRFLEQFPEYSELTLRLLWNRGLKTQEAIDEFFNPDYKEDLHDPFLMLGMKESVERILEAVKKQEKVAIFSDYDADGVCGAVLLRDGLKVFGLEPEVYIPDRYKEGYGLNIEAVKKTAQEKVTLIITIDCGITDKEEIKLANKLGIDVIVVDHHEVPESIKKNPKKCLGAFAVIDPRQKGEKYPFKELAATGVGFKLIQALFKKAREEKIKKIPEGWEKWFLDLVALATITDLMSLKGENRTLVKYGLVVLAQTKRLGLRELLKISGIKPRLDPLLLTTNLNTFTLGYILGPRINAAGRMDHANTAYELMITQFQEKAKILAKRLNSKNQERQRLTEKIIKELESRLGLERLEEKSVCGPKIIFEGDESWPLGIIGLIASRLTNKYWRPSIVYQKLDGYCKGSARSIPGFNIIKAISECQDLLEEFGGHPSAAGFVVSCKNIEKFKQRLLKIANREIKKKDLIPLLNIETELAPEMVNFETYEEIQRFAPFGQENPVPLFLMRNLIVSDILPVGSNGNHMKIYLQKETEKGEIKNFTGIGYGLGGCCDIIKQGSRVDVAFELTVNNWNGARELQFKIADLKKST